MDPVNPKALKGKFKDREDKDIDNDGKVDSSDEYLHKRRAAVSKAIGKMKEAVELDEKYDTPVKKKPVSMMTKDEKDKNDERRKSYKEYQKSLRKESVELDEAAYMSGSSADRAEAHHDQAQKHFDAAENAHSTSEASAHRYAARAHVKAGMSHEKRAENPASKTATAVHAVSSHAHKLTQMAGRIDESVELDELSAVTLGKYSQKARTDALDHSGGPWGKKKDPARVAKRLSGDAMAGKKLDKIRKEEVELDEALASNVVRGDNYVGVPDRVVAQAKEKVKKMNTSTASDHSKAMQKALSDMGWEMTVGGKYVRESVVSKVLDRMSEAKDSYTINHKTFSSAVQHAEEVVNKRGFEVDPEEWDHKVSMGPRKPGAGKTNSYTIALMKNGKEVKQKLQMQVYYDEGRYELNMYIS
jgi:hypothetical protein